MTLLRTTVPQAPNGTVGSLVLESVVTAAESIITYRRRSRLHWHLETVLELLMLDEDNPRSIAFQLTQLMADLAVIPRVSARLRPDQRLGLETSTKLKPGDPAQLVNAYGGANQLELDAFLTLVEAMLRGAAQAVERDHFLLRLPQQRLAGGLFG